MTSQPLVTINGGDILTTTSLAISQHFGKRHKDVLRAIEQLDCSPEFARRNFAPSSYNNSQNKPQPMCTITRDGFVFLCMGFTGEQAALWKERYIRAFSEMEEELIQRRAAALAGGQGLPALALPDPETVQRLERQVTLLRREAVKVRPEWKKIHHYREKGLNQREIGKLLGRTPDYVRAQLKLMAACGLVDYQPIQSQVLAGQKGNAARWRKAQAQGGAQ